MAKQKFYTIFSKHPSAKTWSVERTVGVKTYADEMAKHLKDSGKLVKIKIK